MGTLNNLVCGTQYYCNNDYKLMVSGAAKKLSQPKKKNTEHKIKPLMKMACMYIFIVMYIYRVHFTFNNTYNVLIY